MNTYKIIEQNGEFKIRCYFSEYGFTNYGTYESKAEADAIVANLNPEPTTVFDERMYGDDGQDKFRDTNDEGEPERAKEMNAQPTAEKISVLFKGDGTVFEMKDGTTMDDVCVEYGGEVYRDGDLWRYEFDDGSAITGGSEGWDIEGTRYFSMAGLEND